MLCNSARRRAVAISGPNTQGASQLYAALTMYGADKAGFMPRRVSLRDETLDALAKKAETRRKIQASVEIRLVEDMKGERSAGKGWIMVFSAEQGQKDYWKFIETISDQDAELLAKRLPKTNGKVRNELETILHGIENRERMNISCDSPMYKHTADLISTKPWLVVENFQSPLQQSEISTIAQNHGFDYVSLNVDMERDLLEMGHDDSFRQEYMQSLGFNDSMLLSLVQKLPSLLKLSVFYTVGELEVRAWLYPRSLKIGEASAAIHSDFPRKFLHAEVVKVSEYLKVGMKAKSVHKGREYDLEDGADIVDFKIKK